MGLTLVAFGVLFLLRTFLPALDHISVMRFWPIILIGLGLEVLISALIPQKEGQPRPKIDALSIVVLFLTLFLAFGLAAGQFVLEQLEDVDWGWRTRQTSIASTNVAIEELGDGLFLNIDASLLLNSDTMRLEYQVWSDGTVYEDVWLAPIHLLDEDDEVVYTGLHNRMILAHQETGERYIAITSGGRFGGGYNVGWVDFEFWNLRNPTPADFSLNYRIHLELILVGEDETQSRIFEGTIEL